MAYIVPTIADLIVRYPAFAGVPGATIASYIQTADTTATDSTWTDATRKPAVLSHAAHNMMLLGLGDHGEIAGYARQGVSSIKSGNFSASFDTNSVKTAALGGFDATPYGREYYRLLRANKSGPRVIGGSTGFGGYGYTSMQNNGVPWP